MQFFVKNKVVRSILLFLKGCVVFAQKLVSIDGIRVDLRSDSNRTKVPNFVILFELNKNVIKNKGSDASLI
ncbi:hypothetical protein D8T49_13425 [Vibrio vulnificus]|nr:hypothetical protein [Vibrio vulnificus]EGQ9783351.1 hypothetical protein [Vibrio vulnificus]RZQ02825.1 hypothetical protein D8T37_13225 [Vibrio vulnificus]RZQ48497.1 hypothetical protein D8T49_13425 [Vibrio vulnificus]HAS8167141.1 hypothetical protein [Vibrio vulnificus]